MVGTIVCGIDASESANPVADAARRLADGLGARLVLVHVVEEPAAEAEELVASIRERVRVTDDADVRLIEGSPAAELLEAGDREGAGLLVVGSRGRGAIRSAVLGSVSRTLVTQASCPVTVVPASSHVHPDGVAEASVVCGVDGSEHATAAARLGGELAAALGDRLVLVHALADVQAAVSYPGGSSSAPPLSAQPDARQRLAEELVERAAGTASGVDVTRVIEPGRPWEVLEAVAERESGRLLVVAARGQSAVRETLLGSVASQLAASARRPVVVLPSASA
jgi:nucleotide-binding universal stress UspA family protein